jgi:hypothetical protein
LQCVAEHHALFNVLHTLCNAHATHLQHTCNASTTHLQHVAVCCRASRALQRIAHSLQRTRNTPATHLQHTCNTPAKEPYISTKQPYIST